MEVERWVVSRQDGGSETQSVGCVLVVVHYPGRTEETNQEL